MKRLDFSYKDWTPEVLEQNLKLRQYFGEMANPEISRETIEEIQDFVKKSETFFSTRIEGNITTRRNAERAMETKNVKKIKRSSEKEFKNYFDVLTYIERSIKEGDKITPKLITECHRLLMRDIPVGEEGDETPGVYRKKEVAIEGSEHLPPRSALVESYINELLEYINSINYTDLFVATAIFHHRFAWIHPFNNGNGRLARALCYAALRRYGISIRQMITVSTGISMNKQKYYKYLAKADKTYKTHDKSGITAWIQFYLETLYRETKAWKTRLTGIGIENRFIDFLTDLKKRKLINLREQKILVQIFLYGRIKSEDVKKLLNIQDKDEIFRILNSLVKKGFIKKSGETKGTYYTLRLQSETPLFEYFFPELYKIE